MRRKDREMKNMEDVLQIVKEEGVCRVVMKDEPYPYVVPMNYGAEIQGEKVTLYFHSAMEGRKIDLLKKDGHVAIEIDRKHELVYDSEKGSCSMLYESVIGTGDVTFIEGEEKVAALRCILKQHGRGEEFFLSEPLMNRTACFKVEIKELTGKKH